jgi:hypothetical protein
MATLPPVKVPVGVWVDLYAETGIAPSTQIVVQNIGSAPCFLVDSATQPDLKTTGYNVIQPSERANNFLANSATPDGAWAYSKLGTTLQVEEA